MEIGKLPMAIVSLTICVIVCAVVLIPVVSESTQAYDTYTNDGYFNMKKITSSDETEYEIKWDVTKPNQATVNDDVVTFDLSDSTSQISIICGDDWLFRANITTNAITTISIIKSSGSGTTISSSLTCTLSSGTASVTADGVEITPLTYTTAYIPFKDGSLIMKKSGSSCFIHSESELFAMGLSNVLTSGSPRQEGIKFVGTYDDLTFSVWRPPSDAELSAFSNPTSDATQDTSHNDLYTLKEIKFVFTYTNADESTTDTNLTYSYFVVPAEITSERSVHPDATTTQLINVIPILVIIGIVMLAVGTMIYYRR